MASRKDHKGRLLRPGESYNANRNMYVYAYTDTFGKRHYRYSKDLLKLRKKEDQIIKDQLDGIDSYFACNQDLNYIFDRYMSMRQDLRETTKSSYASTFSTNYIDIKSNKNVNIRTFYNIHNRVIGSRNNYYAEH